MDIRIDGAALGRELSLLAKIVASKPSIPVLANVKMTATVEAIGGSVELQATDLDVGLTMTVPAAVAKPGIATLPATKLAEMVKALPGTEIRIAVDEKGATRLTAGAYASRLQALPPDDFPSLPRAADVARVPTTQLATLSREAVKRMIGQVKCAVAEGDQRYFLAGALLSFDGNETLMVSTDSHRLAKASYRNGDAAIDVASALIPTKALDELAALVAEDGDGPVSYVRGADKLFFTVDGREMYARQVDGQFPAWQRIYPKGNDLVATVRREALATAIRRVCLVSSDSAKSVTLKLSAAAMDVRAASAEVGEADERIVATYTGAPIELKLQGRYVQDFLAAAVGDDITLALKAADYPALFRDGADYDYVVMPLR